MDARFYNNDKIDIARLVTDLENAYRVQGFQVQHMGNNEQMILQLRKGGDLELLLGLQAALSVSFQRTSGGILVTTGQQKWIDKAAVGVVGLSIPPLWPLMITAGAGVLRQASLANQILTLIDGLIHQQQPETQQGPLPTAPQA